MASPKDEYTKLLQAIAEGGAITQRQGVISGMTGNENAREFTGILGGAGAGGKRVMPRKTRARKTEEEKEQQERQETASFSDAAQEMIASLVGPYQSLASFTTMATAAAGMLPSTDQSAAPQRYPANFDQLTNDELWERSNRAQGTWNEKRKTNKRGGIERTDPRSIMAELAFPPIAQEASFPGITGANDTTAYQAYPSLPGYGDSSDAISTGHASGPSIDVGGSRDLLIHQPNVPGYKDLPTPRDRMPANLKFESLASGSGSGLGASDFLASSPLATGSDFAGIMSGAGIGAGSETVSGPGRHGPRFNVLSAAKSIGGAEDTGAGQQPAQPAQSVVTERVSLSLQEAINRLTAAMDANREVQKSVADETKGMSWAERFRRLQDSGNLLPEDAVKSSLLKDAVSQRDIVAESERQEQSKRDAAAKGRKDNVGLAGKDLQETIGKTVGGWASNLLGRRAGGWVGNAAQRIAGPMIGRAVATAGGVMPAVSGAGAGAAGAAMGGLGALVANPAVGVAAGAVALYATFLKLPSIMERFGTTVVESQRRLSQYNVGLQAMFVRLDYQQRVLDQQTAAKTSGSAGYLGRNLESLRSETQEFREMGATIKNIASAAGAVMGRVVAFIIKMDPQIQTLMWILKKIEEKLGKSDTGPPTYLLDGMRKMANYDTPANRRPGA